MWVCFSFSLLYFWHCVQHKSYWSPSILFFFFFNLFKKLQIGNAVINDETDVKGMYDYFESHALISDETAYRIQKYCNFASENNSESSSECNAATDEADRDIYYVDILQYLCPLMPQFQSHSPAHGAFCKLTLQPTQQLTFFCSLTRLV